MHLRVGPAFGMIAALVFPLTAQAQVAQTGSWAGRGRPQSAPANGQTAYAQPYAQPGYAYAYTQPYAQPAYAQPYAQQTYPQAYMQPAVGARGYPAATLTPASYAYTGYQSYGPAPAAYTDQDYGPAPAAYYGPNYGTMAAGPQRDAATPQVTTKDNLHYIQVGMGGFIPTDGGNTAKLGLEANVWAVRGGWVPNSGLYLALDASTGFDVGCRAQSASDGCKGHFRVHWIGAGPFFNTGRPMIASDVQRSWDLMAFTGAEARLWKGMTVKTTINWFLPSPWGVYGHYKQVAESNLNGVAASASPTNVPSASTAAAAVLDPAAEAKSVFSHALGHPQINLMALWEF